METAPRIPTLSEMLRTELELVDNKMHALLTADFGVDPTNPCLTDWHRMAWEQFAKRLPTTEPGKQHHHNYVEDWQQFFNTEKSRRARAEALYAQLDRK